MKSAFLLLTHFMPLVSFDTPWKQKTRAFLMFSGVSKETSGMKLVKHLASKLVWSASFTVLGGFSVPKPSYFSHSSFCNIVYCACLSPSKYLPLKSIEALKFSSLLIKFSSTILFVDVSCCFSPVLYIFIASNFFFRKKKMYQKVVPS